MSEGAILKALDAVNQELREIAKNQKGFGYMFRGIDQVLNTIGPLFKKHKIITRRENLRLERTIRTVVDKHGKSKDYVEVFMHCDYIFTSLEDGSEIRTEGFSEGQDSSGGDKASSMATSNAFKYVIFEMFSIPTEDQKDSDQVTAEENVNAGKSESFTKEDARKRGEGFRRTKKTPVKEEEDVI